MRTQTYAHPSHTNAKKAIIDVCTQQVVHVLNFSFYVGSATVVDACVVGLTFPFDPF